ncbi:MAG: phytanoyl-CoA dioxygenase family protein [Oligoflexales bacterium]
MDQITNNFSETGYLILKNFLSEGEFTSLKREVENYEAKAQEKNMWMNYYEAVEGSKLLNRIENLSPYSRVIHNLTRDKRLHALMTSLTGSHYSLLKDKINFKRPGGRGFKPHQDGAAFSKFTRKEILTVLIPIDHFTNSNGCFEIYNSNRIPRLMEHQNGSLEFMKLEENRWDKVFLKQRDIMIFSGRLIHCSKNNCDSMPRRVCFFTYNDLKDGNLFDEYLNYKRTHFPPELERQGQSNLNHWTSHLSCKIL